MIESSNYLRALGRPERLELPTHSCEPLLMQQLEDVVEFEANNGLLIQGVTPGSLKPVEGC